MNNYNPMFNAMNMTRSVSPFATAGASALNSSTSIARGGLLSRLGGSKVTLSGILNGAQKTIGTVNQIVPLYNQVKPLFQNSKILLNVAKGLKGDNNSSKGMFRSRRRQQNYIQQPIKQENEIIIETEQKPKNKNENAPSKPYFYAD